MNKPDFACHKNCDKAHTENFYFRNSFFSDSFCSCQPHFQTVMMLVGFGYDSFSAMAVLLVSIHYCSPPCVQAARTTGNEHAKQGLTVAGSSSLRKRHPSSVTNVLSAVSHIERYTPLTHIYLDLSCESFLQQRKQKKIAPNGGLEPPTLRLRVSRSTDWASRAS